MKKKITEVVSIDLRSRNMKKKTKCKTFPVIHCKTSLTIMRLSLEHYTIGALYQKTFPEFCSLDQWYLLRL